MCNEETTTVTNTLDTTHCTGNWSSSYEENLTTVSLTSLAQRRDHLSLCYFYKLVNNIFCFPEAPLIPYIQNRTTRAGSKKMFILNILFFLEPSISGIICLSLSKCHLLFILSNVILIHFVNILILISLYSLTYFL